MIVHAHPTIYFEFDGESKTNGQKTRNDTLDITHRSWRSYFLFFSDNSGDSAGDDMLLTNFLDSQ